MDILKAFDVIIFSAGLLLFLIGTISPVTTRWISISLTRIQRGALLALALLCLAGAVLLHIDPLPGNGVPQGTIIAWDPVIRGRDGVRLNDSRAFPKGWRLCDGTSGMPDLNGRFLMGTNATALAGVFSGSNMIIPAGAHNHSGSTGDSTGFGPGMINFPRERGRQDDFMPRYSIAAEPAHDHGGDKRPSNYSVIYLCKLG